jgi:hypothetical protein
MRTRESNPPTCACHRYNIIDEDDLARGLAKRFNDNGKQAATPHHLYNQSLP